MPCEHPNGQILPSGCSNKTVLLLFSHFSLIDQDPQLPSYPDAMWLLPLILALGLCQALFANVLASLSEILRVVWVRMAPVVHSFINFNSLINVIGPLSLPGSAVGHVSASCPARCRCDEAFQVGA